ncbi:hypothetical protein DWUX_1022 [Desulfovibrio diazotrophicus]|nr:hypothetical protein DWUX_1022 [Desulfovibrio diazotrophicus]
MGTPERTPAARVGGVGLRAQCRNICRLLQQVCPQGRAAPIKSGTAKALCREQKRPPRLRAALYGRGSPARS